MVAYMMPVNRDRLGNSEDGSKLEEKMAKGFIKGRSYGSWSVIDERGYDQHQLVSRLTLHVY